jgi:hypothetical protein
MYIKKKNTKQTKKILLKESNKLYPKNHKIFIRKKEKTITSWIMHITIVW